MKKLFVTTLGAMALAAVMAGGAQAGGPAGGDYDILGLKMGMTAKQSEDVIAQRLHVSPGLGTGHYNVMPVPGRYVPGRTYVEGFTVQVGQTQLNLSFTEVPRGAGKVSEELWQIIYTPAQATTADTTAFVAQVVKKYGRPTKIVDSQHYYWGKQYYDNPLDYQKTDMPVLNLSTSNGQLTLANLWLQQHMKSIYNSHQTATPPPL